MNLVESKVIDLRSDTVTKPSESMKKALFSAEVGDDVLREDKTVNDLEEKFAIMMGKEAALFVSSGTMANLLAAMVHCNKRGAEMICGDQSHVCKSEAGISTVAHILVSTLKNLPDGTFDLNELEHKIRGTDIHQPITMMVSVENTHARCGGKVIPLKWLKSLQEITKNHGLFLHMDGARLFNASEYLNEDPVNIAVYCDSLSVCFSKSLGAPVGSALIGTSKFIEQARRYRKMIGGGMRQAGVLAACALVALKETVPLLSEDHKRAKFIAEAIRDLNIPIFKVDLKNQHTNMVFMHIDEKSRVTSAKIVQRLAMTTSTATQEGCIANKGQCIIVRGSSKWDSKIVKFVLHRDIDDEDMRLAVKKITYVLKEIHRNG